MMRALWSAASGMIAQQYNMDTISNNLANVNTTGFKQNIARFQDLVYQQIQGPGSPVGASIVPVGQQVGLGVVHRRKIFTRLGVSTGPLDGDRRRWIFQITLPDGATGYHARRLVQAKMQTAPSLRPPQLRAAADPIPQNAISASIGLDGTVSAQVPGSSQPQTLGQLQLAAS